MTRVLRSGDPRGIDYRNAEARVRDIRSRLGNIRAELGDIGRIEAMMPHDRLCDDVAGAITLAIIALHKLIEGDDRSFASRADRSDDLWNDVAAHPGKYRIDDGESWDWRPRAGNAANALHAAQAAPDSAPPSSDVNTEKP